MKPRVKKPFLLLAFISGLGLTSPGRACASSGSQQIFGYVTDDLGNPVANISVIGDDYVGDFYPFKTDDVGYYSIDVDSDGNYEVTVDCDQLTARGYGCVPSQAVTVAGSAVPLDFVVSTSGPLPPLQITNSSLPIGNVTMPYSAQLGAMNGQPPYTWQLATNSPSLPAGLSLSAGGLISGTPGQRTNL